MKNPELIDQIFVNSSSIHGNGIFTSLPISRGTKILQIAGEIISGDECERREEEENNVYIFWNGDDCYIDTASSNKIKYINHRCDYNCDVVEGKGNSLFLVAAKDIPAGEELTIDYGYEEIYEYCSCTHCENK